MSERYSKLFALPENLYAEGAPLTIAAGALLKDNQTGKVLAQLKFRSISQKEIKAIKVKISPMDTVSHPLGGEVEYQYLDLTARRCDEFGQKSPIVLPNAATRSFTAEVCEVAFADNTVWQTTGEPWGELKKPVSISAAIPDHELRKQIKLEYGNSFEYIPTTDKDLWTCACGELNHKGEYTCARCHQKLSRLLELDMGALKEKCNARLAAEKVQAEKDAAQAKARARKNTKLAAIITPILVVAIVAAVLISGFVKKNNAYQDAVELLNAGEFDKAISAFEALGDYKDSKEQIENVHIAVLDKAYNDARALLESGQYNDAIAAFEALGDYKDSKSQIVNTKLAVTNKTAGDYLENGDYEKAIAEIETLSSYADGQKYIDSLKSTIYEQAIAYLDAGEYFEAKKAFDALADYQDSAEYGSRFTLRLVTETYTSPNVNSEKTYEYNRSGQLEKIIHPAKYSNVEEFFYDDEGRLTKRVKTYDSGDVETREFDTYGNMTRFFSSTGDEVNRSYEYDSDGNILSEIIITAKEVREQKNTYDADGTRLTTEWFIDDEPVSFWKYEYDDHGNCILEDVNYKSGGNRKGTYSYKYDDEGRMIRQDFSLIGGENGWSEYQYDDYGNLVEEICHHKTLGYSMTTNYVYEMVYAE